MSLRQSSITMQTEPATALPCPALEHKPATGTILVTDAGLGSAIAIIRSLDRQGWHVVAGDHDPHSPGFRSRHTQHRLYYPSPFSTPQMYLATIRQAVQQYGVELIIPVTDAAILPLVGVRDALAELGCQLAIPDTDAWRVTTDKVQTMQLAQQLGVPIPQTRIVDTTEQALDEARSMSWPLVLKPQVSRRYGEQQKIECLTVSYANSEQELAEQMERLAGQCSVLLQEYVAGVGQGVEVLMHRGRLLAAFQHERLRELPITGGASALRRSVPLDPQLRDYSEQILRSLDWTGLAMVEFKVGRQGPRLMEINGRVWGSLPLAVHSGMDFPARLAALFLNGPPSADQPPETRYQIGVRSRHLELDLAWIASVLLKKPRWPFLPRPRRSAALWALLGLANVSTRFDILSWRDPAPGLAELAKIARKFYGKAKHSG